MNVYFRRLVCFLGVCLLVLVPVCAVGADGDTLDEAETPLVETPSPVVVQGPSADDFIASVAEAVSDLLYQGEMDEVTAVSVPMEDVDSGIAPLFDLDDGQTTEPTGTLKSILVKLIGPYNPVIVQYRYQTNTSGSYSYLREIQPDYVWCASAGLFVLLIYCTFRLGGALLRKT